MDVPFASHQPATLLRFYPSLLVSDHRIYLFPSTPMGIEETENILALYHGKVNTFLKFFCLCTNFFEKTI